MRVLLDTCTFPWLAKGSRSLSGRAREICEDADNTLYLSALSVWEIALKYRSGKLSLPGSPAALISRLRQEMEIEPLLFDEAAALHSGGLALHHRDPFDRGLISQAHLHDLTVLTPDPEFAHYPVPVLW